MSRATISSAKGHHASCQAPLEILFGTISQAVLTTVYSSKLLNTLFGSRLWSLVMTVPSPPGILTSFPKLNLFTSPKREVCPHALCSPGSTLSSSFSWAKSKRSCPLMSYRVVILPNSSNSSSSSATGCSLSQALQCVILFNPLDDKSDITVLAKAHSKPMSQHYVVKSNCWLQS